MEAVGSSWGWAAIGHPGPVVVWLCVAQRSVAVEVYRCIVPVWLSLSLAILLIIPLLIHVGELVLVLLVTCS